MGLLTRYGLLAILVASYYVQFFIPLFSVNNALALGSTSLTGEVLPWVEGITRYPYHYLTIGLMPFIFSGLIIQLLRWLAPDWYSKYAGDEGSSKKTQRYLLYILGAIAAVFIVMRMPDVVFRVSEVLTWCEIMLSLCLLEQLFEQVKKLRVIASPVMLFLGLNILGGIGQELLAISWFTLLPMESFWFVLSILLAALTVAGVLWSEKWRTQMQWYQVLNTQGQTLAMDLPVKVMRVGIMPLIYASFIFYPLVMMLTSPEPGVSPIQVMLGAPYYLVALGVVIFFFSYRLLLLNTPAETLYQHSLRHGMAVSEQHVSLAGLQGFLRALCKRHAGIITSWFMVLLLLEGFWQTFAIPTMAGLGYVGGISVLLLVSVLKDVGRSYAQLNMEVRYG